MYKIIFLILLSVGFASETRAVVQCVSDCGNELLTRNGELSDWDNTVGRHKDTNKSALGGIKLRYTTTDRVMNWFRYIGDPVENPGYAASGWNFRKVDDYLSVALGRETICYDRVIAAPYNIMYKNGACNDFIPKSNGYEENFVEVNMVARLQIDKKIVSGTYSKNVLVGQLGWCQPADCTTAQFIKNVYLSVNFTVPQTCIINAGQSLDLNFGVISTSAFTTAGVRAEGVSDIVRNIEISCNNIAENTAMTVRLQADKVSGKAVVTNNNEDVGFVVADSNGTALMPNNISSIIPFNLGGDNKSSVTIRVYPVSVTGNKPSEGPVTSQAYLRVDFA